MAVYRWLKLRQLNNDNEYIFLQLSLEINNHYGLFPKDVRLMKNKETGWFHQCYPICVDFDVRLVTFSSLF